MQSRIWLGLLALVVFVGALGTTPVVAQEFCFNGVDDDGDMLVDCFDDDCWGDPVFCCGDGTFICDPIELSTCSCPQDCSVTDPDQEEVRCEDGFDNDCDGLIDGCDQDCVVLVETRCGDGVDNDCDTLFDCDDPDCVNAPQCCVVSEPGTELTCNDGLDNDCNGDVDCDDAACASLLVCTCPPPMGSGTCDPTENPCSCLPDCGSPENMGEVTCDDGIDNDCDGLFDCDDVDCFDACCGNGSLDPLEECDDGPGNSDTLPDACRTDCTEATCGDGIIDTGEDCDLGPANSDDPEATCRTDCTFRRCGDGICDSGPSMENNCNCADCIDVDEGDTEVSCADIFDNDCDGLLNCSDPDCFASPDCCGDGICRPGENQCSCLADCGATVEDPEATCDDGLDNDCDGDFDCDDVDCHGTPECCGNGIQDTIEECDLGLANSDDPGLPGATCRTDCTFATCGDGITDVGEECDGADDLSCPGGCNSMCECPPCGDIGCAVDIRFTAPAQVTLNEEFEVTLRINSITGVAEPFSGLSAVIIWDPTVFEFIEYIPDTEFAYPYEFLGAGLPDDSSGDGFNDTFADGDAYFQALSQLPPNPPAIAPVGAGLIVAKFRFRAIGEGGASEIGFRRDLFSAVTTAVTDEAVAGISILDTANPISITVPCNECACTLDENFDPLPGISVCMHETCDFAGGCTSFQVGYGDLVEPFLLPPLVQTDDILCAVAGFGSYCVCPNADIAGCVASGLPIGTNDILAVVEAFGGANPCGCPVFPQAAAASNANQVGAIHMVSDDKPAVVELQPRSRVVRPGEVVEIDAFGRGFTAVTGFELAVAASEMRLGTVTLDHVAVDTLRSNYVFRDVDHVPLTDMEFGRIGSASLGGAVHASKSSPVYLGTFTYRVSDNAVGSIRFGVDTHLSAFWKSSIEEHRIQTADDVVIMVTVEKPSR